MGTSFWYSWEVKLMIWLQGILGDVGEALMVAFTMFGDELLVVAIMGFIYWSYDKKFGIFIGTNMMFCLTINPMIKNIFTRRRPYFDHSEIKCIKPASDADPMNIAEQGFSFPSGHSMNSVALYSSMPMYKKKAFFIVIGIIMPLFVGISRVALGVHYPTDVLTGWAVGALSVFVTSVLQKKIKKQNYLYIGLFLFSLIGCFYCRSADYYTSIGMMGGFFLAVNFEKKFVNFKNTKDPLMMVLRVIGGLLLFIGLNELLKIPFSSEFLESGTYPAFAVRSVRYALNVFTVVGIYPLIFKHIPEKKK